MTHLRSTLLLLAFALAAPLLAQQQYFVNISGHHTPCDPSVQQGFVQVTSMPGTIPAYDIEVPINENCFYTVTLEVNSADFSFLLVSGCGSQVTGFVSDSLLNVPPGSSIAYVLDFDCSVTPTPCNACFFTAQTVDANGDPIPFSADFTSCTSGGAGSYTYLWDFSWGGAVGEDLPTTSSVLPGPGEFLACLNVTDGNGSTCSTCDTVVVDADGNINPVTPPVGDCLGIPNGINLPGTPCTEPATGVLGTWSADCECLPNVGLPCEADFWVIQAYQTSNTGDTTEVEPIPFELWVWNLSSGGTGNYQFVWDFGDGTSSTEAFPTHTYPGAGPYELCLTITDDAGCTSTHCETIEVDQDGFLGMAPSHDVRSQLTINVVQELPTGIAEHTELEAANLWPNPVQDRFTMQVNSSRSGTVELSILDLNGREVYAGSVALHAGSNRMDLNVDQLESGLYLMRLTSGRQASVLRFVKH